VEPSPDSKPIWEVKLSRHKPNALYAGGSTCRNDGAGTPRHVDFDGDPVEGECSRAGNSDSQPIGQASRVSRNGGHAGRGMRASCPGMLTDPRKQPKGPVNVVALAQPLGRDLQAKEGKDEGPRAAAAAQPTAGKADSKKEIPEDSGEAAAVAHLLALLRRRAQEQNVPDGEARDIAEVVAACLFAAMCPSVSAARSKVRILVLIMLAVLLGVHRSGCLGVFPECLPGLRQLPQAARAP
jgi:hypothetical protein